jgi:hypothetical protein
VIEFDADATVETVIPLESPSNPEHDDKSWSRLPRTKSSSRWIRR